ncbi:RHS repeat-associated core domain-containing protein [Termitidicoccus mucosus]|uniref:RHS repeat-associated core domain-containing protein n=1 Tax=Termitidicoccus mucosus TaxID=1184151 RepID=UPI002FEE1C7B
MPTAPQFVDPDYDPSNGPEHEYECYVVIPHVEGVTYYIDGGEGVPGEDQYYSLGDTVTVTVVAEEGYHFPNNAVTTWTHTFGSSSPYFIVPVAPVFVDPGYGGDEAFVNISHSENVTYRINGMSVGGGEYGYFVGNTVTVTIEPATGYFFAKDAVTEWTHSFGHRVVPAAPMFIHPESNDDDPIVDIPGTEGVIYRINGNEASEGENHVSDADYVIVTAEPAPGCYFPSGTTTEWTHLFVAITRPTGLIAGGEAVDSFTLSWTPAMSKHGTITGYEVCRDGVSIGTTSDTQLRVTGLAPGIAYLFEVRASDSAGNSSDWSTPFSFTTGQTLVGSGTTLPGAWAAQYGLSPSDVFGDPDNDGLTNIAEYNLSTNPTSYDAGTSTLGNTVPAGWPSPATGGTHAVGTTAGEFSVDKNGAATYTIPIAVTPGTAGVEPKVTLNYSSQAGAGIAGFGWSIGGLSAISRGPQTKMVDGQNRAMDFTGADRFYLDGQRLVVIGDNAYGAEGAEYRTEIESFTRVVSYGASGNSPGWFRAWTKGGLIIEFGHTDESRFRPQNQMAPLSWAVNKISDTAGNYMTFHYSVDAVSGQQVLDEIRYTGHDGDGTPSSPLLQPYASLEFVYENRPDTSFGYIHGAKISSLKRLKKIRSLYGETEVRAYTLSYTQRPYSNRSLLASITESGAGGAAYLPLTFAYSDPPGGFDVPGSAFHPPPVIAGIDGQGRLADQGVVFIDLNGDGRADCLQKLGLSGDVAAMYGYSGTVVSKAWLNTPSGWVEAIGANGQHDHRLPGSAPLSTNMKTHAETYVRLADFNNDGLIDVFDGSTGNTYLSTGTGFVLSERYSVRRPSLPNGYNDEQIVRFHIDPPELLDLDGDGRVDVSSVGSYFIYETYPGTGSLISIDASYTWFNTGGGSEADRGSAWTQAAPEHTIWTDRSHPGTRFLDLNGDGMTDILQAAGSAVHAYIKTPTGWQDDPSYHLPVLLYNYGTRPAPPGIGGEVGDLNGDGLPDVITRNSGGGANNQNAVYINTGTGWTPGPASLLSPDGIAIYHDNESRGSAILDINNDGIPDFVHRYGDGTNFTTRLGTGTSWSSNASGYQIPRMLATGTIGNPGNEFIDLNADGAADLVWAWNNGGIISKGAYINRRVNPDRLTVVTNGLGVKVSVSYAPLTAPAPEGGEPVYEKGAGATTPVADAIGPLHVVKTVSHDDGADGTYDIDYRYGGLRSHLDRGSLGFAWMQATDTRTQIRTKTHFNQEWPCIGLSTDIITQTEDDVVLSQTATDYAYLSLNGGKTVFPHISQTIQNTRELNGALTSETVTTYTYNIYGNATVVEIDTSGGGAVFTKTTTSTYADDDDWIPPAPSQTSLNCWMLGRLLSSTVTTTTPATGGGAPLVQTRTSDFGYDSTTGLLNLEIIEPGEADASPLKLTTTYTHDAFGNTVLATTTGAGLGSGRTAATTYDDIGRFPQGTSNALGQTETYEYDSALGVRLSTTGPNGLTTSWEYDGFARPVRELRADGTESITRHRWAGSGAPTGALYYMETESTGSAPAVTFYDKMGRAIATWGINPGGTDGLARIVTAETQYDEMGRAFKTSLPHYLNTPAPGWAETLLYDDLNRPLEISTPDDEALGGTVLSSIEYDGLVTRTINPLGQVEEVAKNTQGQVIRRVNNAAGTGVNKGEIHYYYDAYGSLLKTSVYREDGSTVDTTFAYDNRGRKTGMTSPDMGTWTYAYNALGELVSQTDAKGQTTTMTYDPLGRLATRTDKNSSGVVKCTTTWTYDNATTEPGTGDAKSRGRLLSVLVQTPGQPDYQETFLYDHLGRQSRLTRRIDDIDYAVNQEYDSCGRPSVTVYPGGFRVRNVYNDLGFLKEVRADGGVMPSGWLNDVRPNHRFWQADAYTVTGALKSASLGNGLASHRVISSVTGRVREVFSGAGTGCHAQYHTYNYDALGQVVNRTDYALGREETFAYDGLNRLTQWQLQGAGGTGVPPVVPKAVAISYNAIGNITQKSDYGVYSYTGVNAGPHAVTSVYDAAENLTRNYAYDGNGNMTTGAGRELAWTVFNQVETITQGATSTNFRFGAGRERIVQEHSDGTKTIYIGDLYELVINAAASFTEEKYHVWSPLGKVATRTVRSDSLIETRYHHLDALGSIVAVTDEWGRVEKRFAFDPWGKREALVDTHTGQGGKVTRGFTGHEHLDDFGLIHMNGRVFDPALGRFLSADPFVGDEGASQAYNRYSYVDNNPLNATDPSGYLSFDDVFRVIVVAAIVIAVAYSAGTAAAGLGKFWSAVAAGAAGGFTGGFVGTLAYDGSLNDALKAGLIGGAIGAATAAASSGIGTLFGNAKGIWANDYVNWTGCTLAHATVGGLVSEAQGGEFRHGFYSSAFSNGIMHGGLREFMGGDAGGWYVAARTAVAALIGGTAAELAGGKFVNGAATSAMQHLFNAEASKAEKRKHPMGVILIDQKMIDTHDPVAIEAKKRIDRINMYLERYGAPDRVILQGYNSLSDLEETIISNIDQHTKLVATIAHGIFRDPNDLTTYMRKVSVNGTAVSDIAWKDTIDQAMAAAFSKAEVMYVHCNILKYDYNTKWYNAFMGPDGYAYVSALKAYANNKNQGK